MAIIDVHKLPPEAWSVCISRTSGDSVLSTEFASFAKAARWVAEHTADLETPDLFITALSITKTQ